jgi:hypothetical protein
MKYDNLTFEEMVENLRSAIAPIRPYRGFNKFNSPDYGAASNFAYVKIDADSITTGRLTADRILFKGEFKEQSPVRIKKVVFNNPATIVFWEDGTKTVVKAYDEEFDKEKGLAMAIIKKLHNNKGNFNDLFRKWIPE